MVQYYHDIISGYFDISIIIINYDYTAKLTYILKNRYIFYV